MREYKIKNIHRNIARNKGTDIENLFYAELVDAETDEPIISATLEYILKAIVDRNYKLAKDKI